MSAAYEGCVRVAEVTAALDGRLDPEATAAALRHAGTCASCRDARQVHASLRGLARAVPRYLPDPLAARRVRAAVMRSSLADDPVPMRRLPLSAAAVVLFALTATVGWRLTHTDRDATSTHAGFALAGSGTMIPSPGAVVAVRRAGHDTRIELTSGEVAFVVEHRHAGERFVVATADAEVEVRGTRFMLVARGGLLRRVEVTRGVVTVRRPPEPERRVTAGMTVDLPVLHPVPAMADEATVSVPAPTVPANVPAPPSLESASPVRSRPVARRPVEVLAEDFRAGALAYVRGDSALAAAALRRFLEAAPSSDARREDARYVLVLSLVRAGRSSDAESAALAYLHEFPLGLRRPEVAMQLALSAARRGDCDRASGAALALPEDADAHVRTAIAQALTACHGR